MRLLLARLVVGREGHRCFKARTMPLLMNGSTNPTLNHSNALITASTAYTSKRASRSPS